MDPLTALQWVGVVLAAVAGTIFLIAFVLSLAGKLPGQRKDRS